jgi:hypothetical protein
MNEQAHIETELKPCPNPWCVPSSRLRPRLIWTGQLSATVECESCGMQGPSVSPVVINNDGEQVGTRDAEAEAIAAWNQRTPSPQPDQETVERAADAIASVSGGINYDYADFCRDAARAAIATLNPGIGGEVEKLREALDRTHKLISQFALSGFTDEEVGMALFANQAEIHAALSTPAEQEDR